MSGMAEVPAGWEPPMIVQPSAPAGSVLVYNGHCWHAGGANTSEDKYRCSAFGHYRKSLDAYPAFGGRIFQCDPAAGFPAEWWEGLSQRNKELLGMTDGPQGPPPCATHDPEQHLNGDFGGFQCRQFTDGEFELVTEVPGFKETANSPLARL